MFYCLTHTNVYVHVYILDPSLGYTYIL